MWVYRGSESDLFDYGGGFPVMEKLGRALLTEAWMEVVSSSLPGTP